MSYQLLKDDNTDFQGYGTTPNTPPGAILQSGGGVAHFIHGGPGVMYSRNAERGDIFGNSTPRTDKTYGNLYDRGPSYRNYPYAWDHNVNPKKNIFYPKGVGQNIYDKKQLQPQNIEKFKLAKNTTQIVDDNFNYLDDTSASEKSTVSLSQYWALGIFILLFIAINYWILSGEAFLNKYFFKGSKPEPWHFLAIAIILTLVFFIISYFSGISIKVFETL